MQKSSIIQEIQEVSSQEDSNNKITESIKSENMSGKSHNDLREFSSDNDSNPEATKENKTQKSGDKRATASNKSLSVTR